MLNENANYIRCLFCQSGNEQNVVRQMAERKQQALYPQKIEAFYRKGAWRDVQKPLLPGYVFIASSQAEPIQPLLKINGVIRVLTYDDNDKEGYLNGKDRQFVQWLFSNDGIMRKLYAIREGNYVHIVEGWLKEYNGRVEKINHQKRLACLSIDVMGSTRHIWLGFQYIENVSQSI